MPTVRSPRSAGSFQEILGELAGSIAINVGWSWPSMAGLIHRLELPLERREYADRQENKGRFVAEPAGCVLSQHHPQFELH